MLSANTISSISQSAQPTSRSRMNVGVNSAAARAKFDAELDDDLNVPGAMAAVFELVREVNPLLAEAQVGAEFARIEILADVCIDDAFNEPLEVCPYGFARRVCHPIFLQTRICS